MKCRLKHPWRLRRLLAALSEAVGLQPGQTVRITLQGDEPDEPQHWPSPWLGHDFEALYRGVNPRQHEELPPPSDRELWKLVNGTYKGSASQQAAKAKAEGIEAASRSAQRISQFCSVNGGDAARSASPRDRGGRPAGEPVPWLGVQFVPLRAQRRSHLP